ncbi:MAG: hypothetical protein M1269_07630 [Chloroflexi bacterium]|nr:hypothetical protein [Chloroflexota bacterium]
MKDKQLNLNQEASEKEKVIEPEDPVMEEAKEEAVEALEAKPEFLRLEYRYGDIAQFHVTSFLKRVQTGLFRVDLLEAAHLGKCLLINNRLKLAEVDEFVFYETLVHPVMCLHPRPASVLLIGGGGGGALREILRHRIVEKVVMLERDKALVDLCKEELPFLKLEESLADPRVTLITEEDALVYLAATEDTFDVVIFDINEPSPEQPGYEHFNLDSLKQVESKMKKLGIMVISTCPIYHPLNENPGHKLVYDMMSKLFPRTYSFLEYLTSHHALFGFVIGSRTFSPTSINKDEIDRRLEERGVTGLRYYDGLADQRLFSLPKYMKKALENPTA